MKEFTLPLLDTDERPIVRLDGIDAMLATGTVLPIWNGSEDDLKATGAILIREDIGTGTTYGDASGKLYEMHDFTFGEISYPTLHILCSPSDFVPCQMLLGSAMFEGLSVGIDNVDHKLTIKVPDGVSATRNIIAEDEGGKLKVSSHPAEI